MRTTCVGPPRIPASLCRVALALAVLSVLFPAIDGVGYANDTRIGLHGGLSIPSIRGGNNEQSEGYSSRLGPYFGVFADYVMGQHFSLRGEINYASQGGKRDGMQPISADQLSGVPIPEGMTVYANFNNETILDYVEIPVMAMMSWGHGTRFFVDAGPYVGFLVRAKTVTSGSSLLYSDASGTLPIFGEIQSFDASTDIKGDINSTNAGIAGGIGIETPFGPGGVCFSVNFSMGLSNIQRDTEANGRNRTGAVAVTIGYFYSPQR
jgi:Outer membrane protein beta-barrel domain